MAMSDALLYRWLRWLNRGGKQTALRFGLWRWRATHEDRTRLKQENRRLLADRDRERQEKEQARGEAELAVTALARIAGGFIACSKRPAAEIAREALDALAALRGSALEGDTE